jgi:hypothetical protein
MKSQTFPPLFIAFFLAAAALVWPPAHGVENEMRSWTSSSGVSKEAAYKRLDGNRVHFTAADDGDITIDLSALSKPDQELVIKLAREAGHISDDGTGIAKQASPNRLPAFIDGRWKGMHTVYRSTNYRACIDAEGILFIQPLTDGKEMGPELRQSFQAVYIDPDKPRHQRIVHRKIAEFDDAPPPAANIQNCNHEVALEGKLDDEVDFSRHISFAPDEIKVSTTLQDPRGLRIPTNWSFGIVIPRSVEPDPERTLEQLKQMLKGWTLALEHKNGQSETYPLWKSMVGMANIVKATITGPWAEHELEIDLPPAGRRDEQSYFNFGIYQGMTPSDGFNLGCHGRFMTAEKKNKVECTIQFR